MPQVPPLLYRAAVIARTTPGRYYPGSFSEAPVAAGGDDTAAIQAAIDQAAAETGGGIVDLGYGTYMIGGAAGILLRAGVRLTGAGRSACTIKAASTFTGAGLIQNYDSGGDTGLAVYGLTIDGSSVGGVHGIRFSQCSNVVLYDLEVQNCGGHGINITNPSADVLIDSCRCHNNGSDGIMLSTTIGTTVSRAEVTRCYCDSNGRAGIDLGSNGHACLVRGNYCSGNTLYGIYADGGEDPLNLDSIISDNICTGSQYGINATDVQRLTISGNHCYSNSVVGLQLVNPQQVTVSGNQVVLNGQYGINIDVSGPFLANPSPGQSRSGVQLVNDLLVKPYVTPTGVVFSHNIIWNNGQSSSSPGVRVHNGQYIVFTGNDFRDTQVTPTQTYPVQATVYSAPTLPPTAWTSASHAYSVGDLVSDGTPTLYYQCLAAHTSASGNEPGTGGGAPYWYQTTMQPWLTATSYLAGAYVEDGAAAYRCTVAHTSGASTEPGVGGSWQTVWVLVSPTLDGFRFLDSISAGHATSNIYSYSGTNAEAWLWQGQQGTISDDVKFTGNLYIGANYKLTANDGTSVLTEGSPTSPTSWVKVLLNNIQSAVNSALTWTLKRSATATGGAQSQPSSKVLFEASQWNGSTATSLSMQLRANVSSTTEYWLEFLKNDGSQVATLDQQGLFSAPGGVTTRVKAGVPADADFAVAPADGTLVLDTTDLRLYVRSSGGWHYASLT